MHSNHSQPNSYRLDVIENREIYQFSEHTRRVFPRFVIQGRGRIRPALIKAADRSLSSDIYLRNIGRSGIGFVASQDLPRHTLWTISFLQADYVVAEQSVQIRHAHQIEKDVYFYGAQFTVNEGLLSLLGIQPKDIACAGPDEPATSAPIRYEILPCDWPEA